jgi:transketolase
VKTNSTPLCGDGDDFTVLRTGSRGTVIAVGPLADDVIEATAGMDVTVLYAATIRPFDRRTLRATLREPRVVLVEPYLAGTSVGAVSEALADIPHRVRGLGVGREELRRYGTLPEHQAAHGLDAASLRQRIADFVLD